MSVPCLKCGWVGVSMTEHQLAHSPRRTEDELRRQAQEHIDDIMHMIFRFREFRLNVHPDNAYAVAEIKNARERMKMAFDMVEMFNDTSNHSA